MANLDFTPAELGFILISVQNSTIQGKDAFSVAKILTVLQKELERISIPPEVAAKKK